MSSKAAGVSTRIAKVTVDDIHIRGRSLTREMIGKMSFTEAMYLQITGVPATPGQVRVLDACLVTLMEHGITPTVVAARMTYTSAPESIQGAVAAGLASVGSLYVGTMEGCAALLARIVVSDDQRAEARAIVAEHRAAGARLAGFGHPTHRPDDPRPPVLFEVAREAGVAGAHLEALLLLAAAVDAAAGKHITINATGAIAALLLDISVPAPIVRGFALISRCAGLVGHIREEQQHPVMATLWTAAELAVPYEES